MKKILMPGSKIDLYFFDEEEWHPIEVITDYMFEFTFMSTQRVNKAKKHNPSGYTHWAYVTDTTDMYMHFHEKDIMP